MKSVFDLKGCTSWGGKSIQWGLELLKGNLSWQIGFPSSLDIWQDKWIHGASLGQMQSLTATDISRKPTQMVSLLQLPSGEWDYDRVLNLCGSDVLPFVLSIPIPLEDEVDYLYWNLTSNGRYSSKSGYSLAFTKLWHTKATTKDRSRMESSTTDFCRTILWHLPIHNKWKLFIWKIMSKSLPCGEMAKSRNLQWDFNCGFCSSTTLVIESMEHLFRDCPYVSRVWAASSLGIRASARNNVSIQQWLINWLSLMQKTPDPTTSISNFVSTLWHIWCMRNKLVIQGVAVDYYALLAFITMDANNNIHVQNDKKNAKAKMDRLDHDHMDAASLLRNHFPVSLIGPRICLDHIRIKCDASWKTNMRATAGWLFQNSSGSMFHIGQMSFWAKSALQAEAMALKALKFACTDAISLGYRHIDATSDCLNLVLQLNGCGTVNQDINSTLRSIVSLLSLCHCFSLGHCPRNLNRIAHAIA